MEIGSYVEYKTKLFMVCDIIANKAKIISPNHGKRFVLLTNLTITNKRPAVKVTHCRIDYLVTHKETIISLETNRIMKWNESHPTRTLLLLKANMLTPKAIVDCAI